MASCTCADPGMVASEIKKLTKQYETLQGDANKVSTGMWETMYGKSMRGNSGAPAPVRFCHWRPPEISDIGENAWSVAFRAAALAVAIANGLAQAEIADKQQDLAEGYYQQAKFKWDRFSKKYIPLEKKLLTEVSTTPLRTMDCAGAENRARVSVTSAYGGLTEYMARKAKAHRLCIDPSLLNVIDYKQSVISTDTINYNLNDELWFTDYKNDQRWNRRSNILNLGRNLSSEALKYGDVAKTLYGQVGAQIDRAASGIIQALGYYGARNDTYYSTTYLGSGTGRLVDIGSSVNVNPVSGVNPAM